MPEPFTTPVAPAGAPNQTEPDYERGRRTFRRGFFFFSVLFLVGAAYWVGFERGAERGAPAVNETPIDPDQARIINKQAPDNTIDFALFWKVWGLLKDKYVDKDTLDARELYYGAIKGMLAATGDPYTTFFTPKENQQFKEEISGTFEGIGAEIGVKDEVLTIIAPLDDTPAQKAGLQAGDKVLKINDETTANLSSEEAVLKIRGPKGTEVKLNIFRDGEDEARDVTVRREVIVVKSVRSEMKDGQIGYIRLSRFGEDTESEFRKAARSLRDQDMKGLVVDLRSNPGGYLDAAVDVASLMLPSGQVVVIEEDGEGRRKELKSHTGDFLSELRTVVLIDEGSASASEILAGALRDHRENVTLIGEKSFGKGSVQELIPVSNDTSVKITVQHWLTPSGQQINEEGIAPDEAVELTADDVTAGRDPQLDKALEMLRAN